MHSRIWTAATAALATCLILPLVHGTEFEVFPPTGNGKIKIGLKSFTEKCEFIEVSILKTDTAAMKAQKIAAAINNQCNPKFSATGNGATVDVENDVHPNQRVFIHVASDTTGEKDRIKKAADDVWPWQSSGWYTPKGVSTGASRSGSAQGSLTIGTSRYVSQVPTFPGAKLVDLLTTARGDLHANGVPEAELVDLGNGKWSLVIPDSPLDEFVEFGVDDQGLACEFEERLDTRVDLELRDLQLISYNGLTAELNILTALRAAVDNLPEWIDVGFEVRVDDVPVQTGLIPIGPIAATLCTITSPPSCNGDCLGGLFECVWVDLPPFDQSGWLDYCACDLLGGWLVLVDAPPGATITVEMTSNNWFMDAYFANNQRTLVLKLADVNFDGAVDQIDLNLLLAAYDTIIGDPDFNPAADLVPDGVIDQQDLNVLLSEFQG